MSHDELWLLGYSRAFIDSVLWDREARLKKSSWRNTESCKCFSS